MQAAQNTHIHKACITDVLLQPSHFGGISISAPTPNWWEGEVSGATTNTLPLIWRLST